MSAKEITANEDSINDAGFEDLYNPHISALRFIKSRRAISSINKQINIQAMNSKKSRGKKVVTAFAYSGFSVNDLDKMFPLSYQMEPDNRYTGFFVSRL